MRLNADLEKTELPKYLSEGCMESHKALKAMFERSVTDLLHSEACASSFSKQVKLIVETLDTNLKLLKGLKATEAKKYSKEVENLQAKFGRVMDYGKKVHQIQNESEAFEREKEALKKKKITFSKAKNMDMKMINEKLGVLTKTSDKLGEDYKKAKDDLRQQTQDFNEAKAYIFRTFNAHSASLDLRYGDNLELYKRNLSEFVKGLKIATQVAATKDVFLVSPELTSHPTYMRTDSTSKANSVSASSEDERGKRTVVHFNKFSTDLVFEEESIKNPEVLLFFDQLDTPP